MAVILKRHSLVTISEPMSAHIAAVMRESRLKFKWIAAGA
jgi:hypothetical protein